MALARTPATGDSLAGLHAAWKLLHDLDQWALDPKYGSGTDLPVDRLLERIAALHPDTAAPLAATRDHPEAAGVRAAAHAYLRHVLPLWLDTADWTDRARTAYLEQLHTLRTTEGGLPPGPPGTQTPTQAVVRAVLAPLAEPSALSRHEAAVWWRSRSGRGAEQAGWDTTVQTNRIDDLARAHTTEGTPRHRGEAIAAAQRNLTAVTHHHDQHVTTHAARGHLHHMAATLVTLDKAQRTLQEGIWDIAAARRAQHDPAKGPWNGYDEQRATADLTPVLTDGEARIAHLRRRHLDATDQALTDLIPQLTGTPRDGHRHHAMRNHLAPLRLLSQDLTTLASLIDTRRRTCTELRNRLNTRPASKRPTARCSPSCSTTAAATPTPPCPSSSPTRSRAPPSPSTSSSCARIASTGQSSSARSTPRSWPAWTPPCAPSRTCSRPTQHQEGPPACIEPYGQRTHHVRCPYGA
ncbi:hypothetical protein [Streptomyces flaveolus]|uniref:hypothetical protein n=1 Tax=Streptomyces flaveolus TaxID=67297 RepID=UPI0036FE2A8B